MYVKWHHGPTWSDKIMVNHVKSTKITRFRTCSNVFKPCLYKQLKVTDHVLNMSQHVVNIIKHVYKLTWSNMFKDHGNSCSAIRTHWNMFKLCFYKQLMVNHAEHVINIIKQVMNVIEQLINEPRWNIFWTGQKSGSHMPSFFVIFKNSLQHWNCYIFMFCLKVVHCI